MRAAFAPRDVPLVVTGIRVAMPVTTRRRQRARVGEQPAQGEVRPVSTRTLLLTSLGVLLLVAAATAAILIASIGTKKRVISTSNLPQGRSASGTRSLAASYQETAEVPGKPEIVVATLTLTCAQACTQARYTGYAGSYDLKVQARQLSGTAHPSCQSDALVLSADSELSAAAGLPQSLTGTLTRTATCPGTDVTSPVTLRLHRTH